MTQITRTGRFQHGIVRVGKDREIVEDVLEGKIKPNEAREGDSVVDLKDVSITKMVDKEGNVKLRPGVDNYEELSKVELAKRAAEVIAQAQSHYLVWDGPWAVCQSCPFRHSVPLDFQKYDLVDGKPVRKSLDSEQKTK